MTERLYYSDSYLREFQADVVESSPDGALVYLDRTAFYPASGGQPFDTGTIAGMAVTEVIDEGARIAHRVAAPVASGPADCVIAWQRRFDHMQQHTGQHLLSGVLLAAFGLQTVSFHLGADVSTIDVECDGIDPALLREVERRVNQAVCENRAVGVTYEDAREARDLRVPSERGGELRIVTIDGLDRIACGGTHLHSTGEIGAILLRKTERIRQTARIEFLCGGRAVARARADYDALAQCAQALSVSLDEAPAVVATQIETARAADKARRKLELDLAGYRGRELYEATAPDADGLRRVTRRAAAGSLDELRALAQSFTAQPKAVFLAALDEPPSLLLAVSADAGIDAGRALKEVLAEAGGRGGGSPRIAQGSVPARAALDRSMQILAAATVRR